MRSKLAPGVYTVSRQTLSVCESLLYWKLRDLWRHNSAWKGAERAEWRGYMRKYIAALRQLQQYGATQMRENIRRASWRGLPKRVRNRLRKHRAEQRKQDLERIAA